MNPVSQTTHWTLDKGIVDGVTIKGLQIVGTAVFCDQAIVALQEIAARPTGRQLLEVLLGFIQSSRTPPVIIKIATSAEASSKCKAASYSLARAFLASVLADHEDAMFARVLRRALRRSGNDYGWFAEQLCSTPDYRRDGPVAAGRSSLNITDEHVFNWIHGLSVFPLPFQNDDALILKNSVKIVLWRLQPLIPGRGIGSAVLWNGLPTITLTDGTVQNRPPWIGMAHELIHAYYNATATQLAEVDNDDSARGPLTTVLGEYMCVGLGPWANAPISENRIRAEAGVPPRVMY
jgi:hypothetical protein